MGVIRKICAPVAAALALGILLLGGLTAPASAQAVAEAPSAQSEVGAPSAQGETPAAQAETGEHLLGAHDRVRVTVDGEPSLSGEFVVDQAGHIGLPLIGELPAAGLNAQQLARAFEAALEEGQFLNDPRVTADVTSLRPYYIMGEVNAPNAYPYVAGLSVLSAVAGAGGFAPMADQTRVSIRRAGAESEQITPLTPEAMVRPGDTIRVLRGAFYILGEVNRPGEYAFSTGLTALNAVATAAGFTYRANQSRIWIQRAGEADERAYQLRPDLKIYPGDTIRVGQRFF